MELESLFQGVYNGKTVLITGHTGFKGAWLAMWLELMGARVVGYSLDNSDNSYHYNLLNLNVENHYGDIRDLESLTKIFNISQPDIVFHLAAQAIVRRSYDKPVDTFETNILGTINVLEAARFCDSLKAVVIVTTDKVYKGEVSGRGFNESDEIGGADPYSTSKACAEMITTSYISSFNSSNNMLISTARAGNVIGGGDWAEDRLIPDIVRAIESDKKVMIRNPKSVRPWQHVLEPLSGYLTLGTFLLNGSLEYARAWNFGPEQKSCVEVSRVLELINKYLSIDFELSEQLTFKQEAEELVIDSSCAINKLNWVNVWDLEKSIKETAIWYKRFNHDQVILTKDCLYRYIDKARKIGVNWTQ